MEPVHVSDSEFANDVHALLRKAETGTEVIIERNAQPFAVLRAAQPLRRKISECIALMPADYGATIDPDFATDVDCVIAAHTLRHSNI